MKLKKCEKGHFYDGDKYPECPYCNTGLQQGGGIVVTPQSAEAASTAGAPVPQGPVAGWLVVLAGARLGVDYRLEEGKNFFGLEESGAPAALDANAPLADRLLIVAYDSATGIFSALPGSGRQMAYINGKANLIPTPLAAGDEITLGGVAMKFVPFCGEFRWPESKKMPRSAKPAKAARAAENPEQKRAAAKDAAQSRQSANK